MAKKTAEPDQVAKRRVPFSYTSPDATEVFVTGSFCDWQTGKYPLKKDTKGIWKTTISLAPGRYEFRYIVDGAWLNDPDCAERVVNNFGSENCILVVS